MGSPDIYHDSDGNECSLLQAVHREPQWAVSRIQESEKAIERVAGLEAQVEALTEMLLECTSHGELDGRLFNSYMQHAIKSK